MWDFLKNLFGITEKKHLALGTKSAYYDSSVNTETNFQEILEDETTQVILDSQNKIKELKALLDLSFGTIYYDDFNKIYIKVKEMHNKIVRKIKNDELPIKKLSTFYNWRINPFIEVFDKALDPLRPKKVIDESLLADNLLEKTVEKEAEVIVEENVKESIKKHEELISFIQSVDVTSDEKSLKKFKLMLYDLVYLYIKEENNMKLERDSEFLKYINKFNHKMKKHLGFNNVTFIAYDGDKSLYFDYDSLEVFYYNKTIREKDVLITLENEKLTKYFNILF